MAVPRNELLSPPEHLPNLAGSQFASLFQSANVSVLVHPPETSSISMPTELEANVASSLAGGYSGANVATPPPPQPTAIPPSSLPKGRPQPELTQRERSAIKPPWLAESEKPARPVIGSIAAARAALGSAQEWAFQVLDPRPGTLLISRAAHPAAALTSGLVPSSMYQKDAVVLLVKTCSCHPTIFGVLISEPTNRTMDSAFCPTSRAKYPSFVNHTIHVGGPAGPHWTLVHTFAAAGALQLAPGLFAGGCLADAQRRVHADLARPDDLHFFSGYAAFPLDRLDAEIARGVWAVANASAAMVTRLIHEGEHARRLLDHAILA